MLIRGYTLGEELHRSARCAVFRARRDSDHTPVIIKTLLVGIATEADVAAVKREYDVLAGLAVDGVPKPFELVSDPAGLALVIEDGKGSSLGHYIRSAGFDLAARLDIAIGVARVLDGVHRQHVVHRDINPSNILVDPTGAVSLIDFSISTRQAEEHTAVTHPSSLEGTLAYISPEQTGRMSRPVDFRSDLYSLGVTLFELFTGELPFKAVDPMGLVYCHIAVPPPRLEEMGGSLPRSVCNVIGKLLEKAPEDRYQSAAGILADLEACRGHLYQVPDGFEPGRMDIRDRFSIPRKLYGREGELDELLGAFDRAARGCVELALVSGYSGIGKSALVHAVQAPVTEHRGYFVSGKFDQLRLTVPYSAIVTALGDLTGQLLTESDEALLAWKERLLAALDDSGRLVIDVIPELEHIIGPQPPAPDLDATESRSRFKRVFRRFIGVFCRPEHPLVIFLDDLQWIDPASLALIDNILGGEDVSHLLLIGAYRDNEVDDAHPLTAAVNALASGGSLRVSRVNVGPLAPPAVTRLLADTLHCDDSEVESLRRLLIDKTAGNPFFLRQALAALHRRGALVFDKAANRWTWDMAALQAMNITTNVVALMLERLEELPGAAANTLALAACIGSRFDLATLDLVSSAGGHSALDDIRPALEAGLVVPDRPGRGDGPAGSGPRQLRFLHDRVQQAAYATLNECSRQETHLCIGQSLKAVADEPVGSDLLFQIVDHLNRGSPLLGSRAERDELAALNLAAARRALAATAYAAGCDYARAGLQLLPADGWQTAYALTRDLHRVLVDAEYLRGDFDASQALIRSMLPRLREAVETAEVQGALVVQLTLGGKYQEAISTCLEALAILDVEVVSTDPEMALRRELDHYRETFGERDIRSLLDAPGVESREVAVALGLLAHLAPLCYIADPPLCRITTVKMVNLSLAHGHTPASAFGYAFFGLLQSSVLEDYPTAYSFGRLAIELSERHAEATQLCRVTHVFCAFLNHWMRPLSEFDSPNRRGFQAGLQSGELQFAGYHRYNRALCLFHLGTALSELMPELAELARFSSSTRNQHATDPVVAVMRVTADLAGATPGAFSGIIGDISDQAFYEDLIARRAMPAVCHYDILRSQALYLHGRLEDAHRCAQAAAANLSFIAGHVAGAVHEFYAALIELGLAQDAGGAERESLVARAGQRQRQLRRWADNCAENFLHKALLVEAEAARLQGETWRAADLYDCAIEEAGRNGYLQEEALARERAGLFWLDLGRRKIAAVYLAEAHHGYQLWGAVHKADLMARRHSEIIAGATPGGRSDGTTTMPHLTLLSSTGAALDFASVMRASQAISREVDLAELVKKLVRIAVETAGAQRGCLLLSRDGELMIEAASSQEHGALRYRPALRLDAAKDIPPGVVSFVARTRQPLLVADALDDPRFARDAVVQRSRPRSILAVPITNRGDLVGVLYLEHGLAPGVFSTDRAEILQNLAAQAAISLENAGLYEEQKRTEDAVRKALAEVERLKQQLEQENVYLQEEIETEQNFGEILGRSDAIKAVTRAIRTVAATDVNVLITGETGTGKELVARALHSMSARHHKPLIKVNCASVPNDLFESEFFGHVKGAFTGALRNRVGRFELADQGTLFLDEVGEIPIEIQSKLLRVLQEGEFERIGEESTRRVSARIVAATNRDLKQEVEAGRFREDLYYRLNVFPIEVAPLRRRKSDIPHLADHFLRAAARTLNRPRPRLTKADVQRLQGYDWPGNIRELQNVIERAVILARGERLHFELSAASPAPRGTPDGNGTGPTATAILREPDRRERDRAAIIAALERAGGKIAGPGGAAEILGVKPTTLGYRIKVLGIKKPGRR